MHVTLVDARAVRVLDLDRAELGLDLLGKNDGDFGRRRRHSRVGGGRRALEMSVGEGGCAGDERERDSKQNLAHGLLAGGRYLYSTLITW